MLEESHENRWWRISCNPLEKNPTMSNFVPVHLDCCHAWVGNYFSVSLNICSRSWFYDFFFFLSYSWVPCLFTFWFTFSVFQQTDYRSYMKLNFCAQTLQHIFISSVPQKLGYQINRSQRTQKTNILFALTVSYCYFVKWKNVCKSARLASPRR